MNVITNLLTVFPNPQFMELNNKQFTSFPVKLNDAVVATSKWRNWMSDNDVPEEVLTKAFFIPMGDLQALLTMLQDQYQNAIGVRAYVGLGEPQEEGGSALKLLLVGVKASLEPIEPDPGIDIIENIPGTDFVTIYDFTSPCPKFCDASSILMTNI